MTRFTVSQLSPSTRGQIILRDYATLLMTLRCISSDDLVPRSWIKDLIPPLIQCANLVSAQCNCYRIEHVGRQKVHPWTRTWVSPEVANSFEFDIIILVFIY